MGNDLNDIKKTEENEVTPEVTPNNKKKTYMIIGVVVLLIIVIIAAVAISSRNNDTTPDDGIYLEQEEEKPYVVSPYLYAAINLSGGKVVTDKAAFLANLYESDEIFNSYSYMAGKEFLSEFALTTTLGEKVTIPTNTDRIFVFTTGEAERDSSIEAYLYLGALAGDVGVYDLYVINTNVETMGDFMDKYNAHLLNSPTPEEHEFLNPLPDEFIMFVNKNNIIECMSSLIGVHSLSMGGAYVFGSPYPSYDYIRLFEECTADPVAATEKYYQLSDDNYTDVKYYDSTIEINGIYGTNFYVLDSGEVLNESVLSLDGQIACVEGMYTVTEFVTNKDRKFVIEQGIGYNSIVLDSTEFKYYDIFSTDDLTSVHAYGKSQEEITDFVFAKSNIKIHIHSSEPWTTEEIKLIVDNF